jgi:anti-anti-sigma factor
VQQDKRRRTAAENLNWLGGISAEGRFALNTVFQRTSSAVVAAPEGMTELVRGSDQRLVGQMEPLVRDKNIILNCQNIERIDAAGVAALISLYGCAHNSGHTFHVCNVKAHVQEVLSIVGLERILVVCCWNSPTHTAMTQTAA